MLQRLRPVVPHRDAISLDLNCQLLRTRGVDVEYLCKEGEGHGFLKPENRMEAYDDERAVLDAIAKRLRADGRDVGCAIFTQLWPFPKKAAADALRHLGG